MTDPKKPSAPASPAPSAGAAETSFFEEAVRWARSKTSAGADRGITDTVTQAAKFFYTLTYGDISKPGDQRFGQEVAANLDKTIMAYGRPKEFGNYDLMMAAGWQPKGPIKVNGVMTTLDKPVENMLAVFVRNKDGSVELLDPTIKVNGLKEMPLIVNALLPASAKKNEAMMTGMDDKYKAMMRVDTEYDQKWRDTAGAFILTQLAPIAASSGLGIAGAASKAGATKFPQISRAVEIGDKISKAAIKGAAPFVASTTVSGLSGMGGQLSQGFYFTPEAIKKIGDGISSALNAPTITPDTMRHNLNESLHEFSFDQGSDAKQIYIPSLRDSEQPWKRYQQTLQGVITAHEKPNTPWDQWSSAKPVSAPEIRAALNEKPGINYAFYSTVEKYQSGKPLTDRDIFVMRSGLKLGPEDSSAVLANINPAGKSGDLKFTPEERAQTLKYLDEQLPVRLRDKVLDVKDAGKKLGIDPEKIDPANPSFTAAQLKQFVSDSVVEARTAYNAEKKRDEPAPHTSFGMWR